MKSLLTYIALFALISLACNYLSPQSATANGKVIHVVSHDREFVVTDPSQGVKYYPRWAVFPSVKTDYRRVILSITYRCPDGKRCGEWDYIDGVLLTSTPHAVGTIAGKKQIELARVISPYGWQFDSTWYFTWKADVSDFGMLLHDSCEITFKHTGYESNTDRGWLVTLDFEITPGRAPMKCLGIDTLWSGSFPYGDSSKPIDSLLLPFIISHPKAKYARVWLMQTGHGMDETENCAEFCRKWRKLILNDGTRDSLIDERDLWKECSENPLYPQAGTWPFDRANWCPGDVVIPDIHTFLIKSGREEKLQMQMQPYAAAKPTANWYLDGYVFYYDKRPQEINETTQAALNMTRQERETMNPIQVQSPITLVVKTNRDAHQNRVQLIQRNSLVKFSSDLPDTNKLHEFPLSLNPAEYTLAVTDTAGDGLGFWFNPEAGYGYVRLLDAQGRLLKAFAPDFGGSLYYSFIVTDDSTKITPPDSTPQVIVFPPRNFGTFDIDLFASWPTDMTIEIVSDSGAVVYTKRYEQVKQMTLPMDITAQKDGIYFVHVSTERDVIKKRIRLKRS